MSATTLLYIVITAVVALGLSLYMYGYKSRLRPKLRWILGILRFLTLATLGLLLVNPKIVKQSYFTEKPVLNLLIDDSKSITVLNRDSLATVLYGSIIGDSDLRDRFELNTFSFAQDFKPLDSLRFTGTASNIAEGLRNLKSVYNKDTAPVILISDGNQTLGQDYLSAGQTFNNPIFSVVLGDTTRFEDLRIERLNANKYAYQDNEFPVEISLAYTGQRALSTNLVIRNNGRVLKRQPLSFDSNKNAQTLQVLLKADRVGIQTYTAEIEPTASEKNTNNNRQLFAVEVIDQSTKVAIISAVQHPDIGTLKKSITTLKQRQVTVLDPNVAVDQLDDFELIILYQPDFRFAAVYERLETLKKNRWTITGVETDWQYLNDAQSNYAKFGAAGDELVSGVTNRNYPVFAIDPVDFSSYPPLKTQFGSLEVLVPYDELISQTIEGIFTETPLFFSFEVDGLREAVWDGQELWRWRANSYLANRSFTAFDDIIASMVQYLSSNKRRSRLNVSFESFYYSNTQIALQAQYFNENYQFDPEAQLNLSLVNTDSDYRQRLPMLLKNNYYQANLNGLPAGTYNFTATAEGQGIARSGQFTILDFSVEDQMVNPNVAKLEALSQQTDGNLFYEDQLSDLITVLTADKRFVPLQKSRQNVVPLIAWKYLLGLLALLLAAEWFTRKYNGLI